MDRLMLMNDDELRRRVQRLERDVEDFRIRAAKQAAMLHRAGRATVADAMHQRLTSIHGFLKDQLTIAERELELRTAAGAIRARSSPEPLWRRFMYPSRLRAVTGRTVLAKRRNLRDAVRR
jgi:hypothetical protein